MTTVAMLLETSRTTPLSRVAAPRLSLVVFSRGSEADLERAVVVIGQHHAGANAEVVVVREEGSLASSERLQRLAILHGFSVAFVSQGSTRAEFSDAGMELVSGDIVAFREDVAVRDGVWLSQLTSHFPVPAIGEIEVLNLRTDEKGPRSDQARSRTAVGSGPFLTT